MRMNNETNVEQTLAAVLCLSADEQKQFLKRLIRYLPFEILSQLHEETGMELKGASHDAFDTNEVDIFAGHLLQRDFLRLLPPELCLRILSHLDARDLCHVEAVCTSWRSLAHAHGAELWGRQCALSGWDPQVSCFVKTLHHMH